MRRLVRVALEGDPTPESKLADLSLDEGLVNIELASEQIFYSLYVNGVQVLAQGIDLPFGRIGAPAVP